MWLNDNELVEQIETSIAARGSFWTAPWWAWKVWEPTSTKNAIGILRKRNSAD